MMSIGLVLWGAGLFGGCSLQPSTDSGLVKIHFEFPSGAALNDPFQTFVLPELVSAFDCLAVNIMGEGIIPRNSASSKAPADYLSQLSRGEYCSYSGVTSPPISMRDGDVSVELTVPAGRDRVIEIIGISDPSKIYCAVNGPVRFSMWAIRG